MKVKKNIQNEIIDTLNSVNTINDVEVSPFFKDRTLQRLFVEKQENLARVRSWFTPQIQLATLMVFVVLNVFAFTKLDSTPSNDEIDEFAQTYSLSSSKNQSIYN